MSTSIEEKNKAIVLQAFDTLFNQRDYSRAERFWSPRYIQHSDHIRPGREGLFELGAFSLGVTDAVTSPTFSIGHRYRARGVTVSHLDLYRLAGLCEEDPALLADYLGPGRIAFVEWPKDGAPELSEACLLVTLAHGGAERRLIEVGDGAGDDERERR